MALDDRDIAILVALAEDGRITKSALADRVGLSATPCWNRLQRLEKAGLIRSYHARFDLKVLGPHVVVFVAAELHSHTADSFRTFEDAMRKTPEVTACWAIGGGHDFLLQVTTRDIDAYQRLMDQMLDDRIGLARYFSYIVTKAVKSAGAPPFDLLRGAN
nr:Lrp/AsnC family transcriptional regulator [Pseudooceanicola aestuarii]